MLNRTAIFIDGANLYATHKALGFDVDFKRLLKYFKEKHLVVQALYYTAIRHEDDISRAEGYQSIRPLIDYLQYNGYSLVTKDAKTWHNAETGRTKVKGDMDAELCVDALKMAFHGRLDEAVFITGDGDFKPLLLAMQSYGVRCTVISTILTKPPMCADELRRTADEFIDLRDLQQLLLKEPKEARTSRYG